MVIIFTKESTALKIFILYLKTSEKALKKKKFRSRGFCFVSKNVPNLMSYVKIPSLERKEEKKKQKKKPLKM